jgi:hypothetical protein
MKEINSNFFCVDCGRDIVEGIHSKDKMGNRRCIKCKPIKTTPSDKWWNWYKSTGKYQRRALRERIERQERFALQMAQQEALKEKLKIGSE